MLSVIENNFLHIFWLYVIFDNGDRQKQDGIECIFDRNKMHNFILMEVRWYLDPGVWFSTDDDARMLKVSF